MNDIALRDLGEITEEMKSQLHQMGKVREAFVANYRYVEEHDLYKEGGFTSVRKWATSVFEHVDIGERQKQNWLTVAKIAIDVDEVVSARVASQLQHVPPDDRKEVLSIARSAGGKVEDAVKAEIKRRKQKKKPDPIEYDDAGFDYEAPEPTDRVDGQCKDMIERARSVFVQADHIVTEINDSCPNERFHDWVQMIIDEACTALRYWADQHDELPVEELDDVAKKAVDNIPKLCNHLLRDLGNIKAPKEAFDALQTIRGIVK